MISINQDGKENMKKPIILIAMLATVFGLCASTFADTQPNWFNENATSVAQALTHDGKTQDGVWSNLTDQVSVDAGKVVVDADDETLVAYRPNAVLRGNSASVILDDITFTTARKTLPAMPAETQAAVVITTNAAGECVFAVANNGAWELTEKTVDSTSVYKVKVDFHYGDANTVDYSLDENGQWTAFRTGAANPVTGVKVSTVEIAGSGSFNGMSGDRELANYTISFTGIPEGIAAITVNGTPIDQDGKATVVEGSENVVLGFFAKPGYRLSADTVTLPGPITADIAYTADNFPVTAEKIDYVAQINDDPLKKYESLKEAVEVARGGDTIKVLADCEVPETICFYNTGTNAADQITLVNDHHVELTTFGPGGTNPNNYSFYIVNANVKVTGTGEFSKTNGTASAFVVGSYKDAGKSGRPAELGYGILDFEGNLTGGIESVKGNAAPSGMIKVEAGFCNFVGGSVIDWRNDGDNGKCVTASGNTATNGVTYVGVVTIQSGTFKANTPLKAEDGGTLKIVGKDNTAKVRPLNDAKELDYSAFCEPGYTFLKVTDDQDPDYGWYKIGMNTFSIVVVGEGAYGTANPNEFNVETEFPLAVELTKPTAPEGKEFDSWSANHGTIDENDTLTVDAFPNENVIVTVVWKSAMPDPVTPGGSSLPYETREEAEADAAKAPIVPASNFDLTGDALVKWQGLFVNKVYVDGDGKYRFAPVLSAAGSNAVAQAEATLTKAIKVADIAAATKAIETMALTGAEPGFYYTLFKSDDVTTVFEGRDASNSDKMAKADGVVTFMNVTKPSDAAGFFSVKAFPEAKFTGN